MRVARAATAAPLAMFCVLASASADVPPAKFANPDRREILLRAAPRIEALIADRMQDMKVPGLAYGIVIDGEPVILKGLGVRDVEARAPVDAHTVFRIASMSKSVVALGILTLRDAGRLALDDPAERYVPELKGWKRPTADAGPITLRHLLAHASGLPEDNPQGDRALDISAEALSRWLRAGVPFSTSTGSEFEYSNLGFVLLGRVIARVSGRPFERYLDEEILRPLGMASTYWAPSAVPPSRLAKGYRRVKDDWVPEPMLEAGEGGAAAGLMTSATDLARYVAMMLSAWPPRDEPERAPLLRRTLREAQTGLGHPAHHVAREGLAGTLVARSFSYGFGLDSIRDCRWGREVAHSGGLPGFGSHMRWLPDHGVGVFVLANRTYANAIALTGLIVEALDETGGLDPRVASPSPGLEHMADAAAELAIAWSDERAREIAADNLFPDQSLAERKEQIEKARTGLGACRRGALEAENALRGRVRVDCENGWLDVGVTLAPLLPLKIQSLTVRAARPPNAAMREAAESIVTALVSDARTLRLAPAMSAGDLAARLSIARQAAGSCRLGETIGGDGSARSRFALRCDRGRLELSLSLDQGRIASVDLRRPESESCSP